MKPDVGLGILRSATGGFGNGSFGDGFTGLIIEARAEPTR